MKVYSRSWLNLGTIIALSACSGDLHIYDKDKKEVSGVPFRLKEVWLEQGTYKKLSKGGPCDATPFTKIVSLASGDLYYAKPETAPFAKTQFTMKLDSDNSMTEITLNSEPSAEAIRATTDLIKTTAQLAGAGAAATPEVKANPACDTGEDPDSLVFSRFADRAH